MQSLINEADLKEDKQQKSITIRAGSELISSIGKLADAMDRPRNWVIEDALRKYIDLESWQIAGIEKAIESLDDGDGIDHHSIKQEFEKIAE